MTEAPAYVAVDLGAESGRVILGRLVDGAVRLESLRRFPNSYVALPDGLRWNLVGLFLEVLEGLRQVDGIEIRGVGIDAWGVDYALLDEQHTPLGLPFHYRDRRTDGMVEAAHSRVPAEAMYARTGIQAMQVNTVFQLLAEEGSTALAGARRIALVPDLLSMWLTGELANEATIASTTGLLEAGSGGWARDVIAGLGLPEAPFTVDPVEPGTVLGPLRSSLPLAGTPVHLVAAHDTASAFIAAGKGDGVAVLSSGTWSLLGVERPEPVLDPLACSLNFTNERGFAGATRLLRNVMGLWLLQRCRARWGVDHDELNRLASIAPAETPLFDPDHPSLLNPDDMPAAIASLCVGSGQSAPLDPGETTRAIFLSLACKYRLLLERLELLGGQAIGVVHIVGGGARNGLFCRFIAEITGRVVTVGPAEATAVGNVLLQAYSAGELASPAEVRQIAAAIESTAIEPPNGTLGPDPQETYERFLRVTGLVDEVRGREVADPKGTH